MLQITSANVRMWSAKAFYFLEDSQTNVLRMDEDAPGLSCRRRTNVRFVLQTQRDLLIEIRFG